MRAPETMTPAEVVAHNALVRVAESIEAAKISDYLDYLLFARNNHTTIAAMSTVRAMAGEDADTLRAIEKAYHLAVGSGPAQQRAWDRERGTVSPLTDGLPE